MASLSRTQSRRTQSRRGAQQLALPLSGLLGISTPVARIILLFFIGVHVFVAFADKEGPASFPMEGIGVVSVAAAAIWVTKEGADPLPRLRTAGILALCAVTTGMLVMQISPIDTPPYGHWHLGAITLVLVMLVARGRPWWAWFAYAGLFLATVGWALAVGLTALDGVALVIRHAGTLLAGTLFLIGLRRTTRALADVNRTRTRQAAIEATELAALAEREAELARVNALARPTLVRLAQEHALDAEERAECLLVEATLRDAIRGRGLFIDPVIGAARAARARGVEVMLLDDSGDLPLDPVTDASRAEPPAIARAIAEQLQSVEYGRFTARLLPRDRAERATIVIGPADQRMLVVAADGTVRPV
ncbi:hypothetical protein [Glaciibacter superstes]|uniref:hypothetical protein n=1 Tax=Glaciibacter superstes TaxID=501023 RepID=UPI0003B732A0|nr:hypothetical protein [Glaciibacter superstes]